MDRLRLDILTKIFRRIFNQNPCITKKTGEKFGGYRLYSYICNRKNKLNKDFFRLKRLYVNTASSFCMIIGFIGFIGSSDHRILDGCQTDVFWLRERKKSLEEILFKMLLRKKYFREIAILNRFLGRLGPQILHEDFLQDFLPTGNYKYNH